MLTERAQDFIDRILALETIAATMPPRPRAYEQEFLAVMREFLAWVQDINEDWREVERRSDKNTRLIDKLVKQKWLSPSTSLAICGRCQQFLETGEAWLDENHGLGYGPGEGE